MEIILDSGHGKAAELPATYQELPYHPHTKKPGRYGVRTTAPRQVWDKDEHRMKWVRFQEVEQLPEVENDGFLFIVANAGYGNQADLQELSEEAAERRGHHNREKPLYGPPGWMIKEACHQIQVTEGKEWNIGDHTFKRKSVEISIPKDKKWADAMAEEARRGW